MTKGRNTTVVGVRLPDETVAKLKRLAHSRRRSVSELMKQAISDYIGHSNLNKPKKQKVINEKPVEPEVKQEETFPKVGRNDPCPCGSGLKYKRCHGKY